MKTIKQLTEKAIKDNEAKVNHFIASCLGIEPNIKISWINRLKFKLKGISIIRQDLGDMREKISVCRYGKVTDTAEFNIKIQKMKNKFNVGDKVIHIKIILSSFFEVGTDVINSINENQGKVTYWLENDDYKDVDEKELYTKQEAIEFLKKAL